MKLLLLACLVVPSLSFAAQVEGWCGDRQVYRVAADEVYLTNPMETFIGQGGTLVSTNGNTYIINRARLEAELITVSGDSIPCVLRQ